MGRPEAGQIRWYPEAVSAPSESLIQLPTRATVEESFQVLNACEQIERLGKVLAIDASTTTMFGPMGVALLALALARRRTAGLPDLTLRKPESGEARRYLEEVGFSRFLTSEHANENPSAGTLEMRHLFQLVPVYTEQMARLIADRVPGTPEEVSYLIQLCLNELLQNVFEHAESKEGCFVLARWYAKTRSVRIAVADGGVGIPAALRRKGIAGLQRRNDADVVIEAVTRRGITSRLGTKQGGFGLKLLREAVTERGGKIVVLSSTAKVVFKRAVPQKPKSRLFRGTAIELDFRPLAPTPAPRAEEVF